MPAITHVDYSARVQTVQPRDQPALLRLIKAFEERTGYGIIINTSFNVRGEPIVCTPEDAYRCFMRTEMDYLVLGNHVLDKEAPAGACTPTHEAWQETSRSIDSAQDSAAQIAGDAVTDQRWWTDMSRLTYLGRFMRELVDFAKQNKAWWIIPTVLVLLVLGLLIFTGQAAAPFIYTIF